MIGMSKHVMECLGVSEVTIEDGKVVGVTEPRVKYCPMFKKMRGIDELNCATIRENIEYRIGSFGMCCENRQTEMDDVVTFGVSEILSLAIRNGDIDAVVLAADGCGTAVITKPELIQGLGGRISGIRRTQPIPVVVDAVGEENMLDPETAEIDMVAGAHKAFQQKHRRIAVTTTSVRDASEIRDMYGANAIIVGVHTTGMSEEDARTAYEVFDIITACASKHLREEIPRHPDVMLAGSKVPIIAVTDAGKRLVRAKLDQLGREPHTGPLSDDQPYPLQRSLAEVRIDLQMRAGSQEYYRHAFLPQPAPELLVVGENVSFGMICQLDHGIVSGMLGRDYLVFPGEGQSGPGGLVVEVLQLPDQRSRHYDPGIAQEIPDGDVEIQAYLKRHE